MRRKALKQKKNWNPALFGIRNPLSWNPESSTRNPESTGWNPESKTVMDSLTWGDWLVKIWQVSSCRKFIQHLETCLLWQLKLTEFFVNLWCFLLSFASGCIKWNTAALSSLLLFIAGLFIECLVEKCTACQSLKSDFGWHRFRFSPCWMRVEKSFKRFWPYLVAFRSCISNGKPE